MKLADAKAGQHVKIDSFLNPYCDIATRVCSMGLYEGQIATIISNHFLSPVLLDIDGVRLAISKTEAKKIAVTLL